MSYIVPSFSGQSYLRLKKLHDVNRVLKIELDFKALNEEGILLYSGEEQDKPGDFVSLSLRDGFVEFRCVRAATALLSRGDIKLVDLFL